MHVSRLSWILALPVAFLLAAGIAGAAPNPWSDVLETSIPSVGPRVTLPDLYRTVIADVATLQTLLDSAPMEFTAAASMPLEIELPLPDGSSGLFAVLESPILAPELGALFPEIRTFIAHGIDDPGAMGRLDYTQFGFHGMILGPAGTVYIDPYQRGDVAHYQVYWRSDLSGNGKQFDGCEVLDEDGMTEEIAGLLRDNPLTAHGTELRTYRAAIGATAEYTGYFGGTVPGGLAGITTTLNRVSGIYEKDVSIRMQLIANNNLIVYTNTATDGYTHGNPGTLINENQAKLDSIIGSANYDIGHVVDTSSGGLAGLGVVCRTGQKARGTTGVFPPTGDGFDVDYVAHEMGHQFGSNHSFNGTAASCAGNRVASKAYEPGSGSTIMAYAGICGAHNLQAHSDPYFIWSSIDEIITYTTVGAGNGCPVVTATGAVPPIVEAGLGGWTIPISTPFELTGSATTTGTPTYCWEESDLGPAGAPNSPTGNAPIFRSFNPVTTPWRTFPRLSNLLNNTQTVGEILPTYTRDLSFKMTVRDVQAGGCGVDKDGLAFHVTSTAGPFLVTAPNLNGLTFQGGSTETVTWNVASTNLAPVSCATVNILLTVDGGVTYPYTLAAATANDGSESITLPNVATVDARVKVAAVDNIFFDISNFDFEIEESASVEADAVGSGLVLYPNQPNPFNPRTSIRLQTPSAGQASLCVYDLSGRQVKTLLEGRLEAGEHTFVWDGTTADGKDAASGVYVYELRTLGETRQARMTLLR